jgi:hypothetical protein
MTTEYWYQWILLLDLFDFINFIELLQNEHT